MADDLNWTSDAAEVAALKARYLETVRHLLAAGADPNVAWRSVRVTPLLYACQGGPDAPHLGVVQALLEAGADPERADATGMTPLMVVQATAVWRRSGPSGPDPRVISLLQDAIAAKHRARSGRRRCLARWMLCCVCVVLFVQQHAACCCRLCGTLTRTPYTALPGRTASAAPGVPAAAAAAASAAAAEAAAPSTPQPVCAACGRTAEQLGPQQKLLRCGGCKAVRYCSDECQRAAWPVRSWEGGGFEWGGTRADAAWQGMSLAPS